MDNPYLTFEPVGGNVTVKEGAVLSYEGMLPNPVFTAEFT